MSALHLTGRARAAAHAILQDTSLRHTLGRHLADDGRLLTIEPNIDVFEMMSSGERVLYGVIEQLADHRSTTTWHEIGSRLDVPSKRSVIDALGMLWGVTFAEVCRCANADRGAVWALLCELCRRRRG